MAMQKRNKIILWVVGLLVAIPLGSGLVGFVGMRISQPQMFEEPVIDTVPPVLPADIDHGAVLVFSKTSGGFRHGWSIDAANEMIGNFAQQRGWQVYFTENAAVFNDDQLPKFAVVVWNNATGAALSKEQRNSFRIWLEAGGGYVGLHAAGDGSHESWDWYTNTVIKAPYNGHTLLPEHTPEATVTAEDRDHPATAKLPASWQAVEEWYAFHENPRDNGARILVTVVESSYTPGSASMGDDHPLVWSHELGAGRVFYSAFGHTEEAYADPLLMPMMEQAIIWSGRLPGD
jgi:type 1 glutamine amidotransferase